MKNSKIYVALLLLISSMSFSQSVSTSPYSIYGIGNLYQSDFGPIPSLGSSGLALPSSKFINNLNPASFGFLTANHFLFDVGGKVIQTEYKDNETSESRNNVQFSHIGFAFPVTSKSGINIVLKPYTSSSYKITGLKLPIENSIESYYLSVLGSGGLNNFDVSYGYQLSKKWALGLTTSFLFGNTNDTRNYYVGTTITTIDKDIHYNGIRPVLGLQYQSEALLSFGGVVKFPAQVNASKVQTVSTVDNEVTTSLQTDVASNQDDFYIPLELGVGVSAKFKNNLQLTLDYERSFWSSTNQSDLYGSFVDSNRFAMGFLYKKPKERLSYFDRVQYSGGFNFDTGSLEVNNKKIEDKSISIGLSLPIDYTSSALNISYSYGQRAKISGGLIKENYHKLSLNLSLDGIWFVKRKIN